MLLIGEEGEPDSSSIARERCRSSAASSVESCTETPPSGGESSCVRRRRRPQEVDKRSHEFLTQGLLKFG